MPLSPNDLADLADRILSAWETVYGTRDDLTDIIDRETFLGIQYAQLHADGIAKLTQDAQAILEHTYETLINAQAE